jgi:hypothetical protein
MNLHGFSIDQAEEILRDERLRKEAFQRDVQHRIYMGELDATDAEDVSTIAGYDNYWGGR